MLEFEGEGRSTLIKVKLNAPQHSACGNNNESPEISKNTSPSSLGSVLQFYVQELSVV